MSKDDVVKDWLKRAEDDYKHVKRDLPDEDYFYSHLAFFLEQAAEKYLKAYIIAFDLQFEYTHDLLKLLEICKAKDKEFAEFEDVCQELNPYYVDTRYPVHWPVGYRKEDIEKGLSLLEELREFILEELKK